MYELVDKLTTELEASTCTKIGSINNKAIEMTPVLQIALSAEIIYLMVPNWSTKSNITNHLRILCSFNDFNPNT